MATKIDFKRDKYARKAAQDRDLTIIFKVLL